MSATVTRKRICWLSQAGPVIDPALMDRDDGNNTATVYTYDDANRVKTISHVKVVNAMEQAALMMSYSYNQRDLPTLIVETSALGGPMATVRLAYDDRGRLTREQRAGDNAYDLAYAYDLGGNRRKKTDVMAETEVIYEYDIDDTALFGTANNRLMTESLQSTAGMASTLLSTKYYYYTFAGNVERVVTELASPGNGVPKFSAVRFDYAANAQIATYVVGESWDVDADLNGCPDSYTVTFAREFRYDGARQRYLDRMLDEPQAKLGNVVPVLSTWTDYDGDNTYSDFTVSGSTVTDGTGYELGLAQINRPTPTSFDTLYAHNDHLGTLRAQSNGSGFTGSFPVHTAFGEDMTTTGQRFGYAGSSGYQTNVNFDSLHVGARYYDPSTGRFLQRDPIGIDGSLNVYEYVESTPTIGVDPSGLQVSSLSPAALAANGFSAKEIADILGIATLCAAAANRRPRLGDRVDGTPTFTNPKYPRIGRNPNKLQKGGGCGAGGGGSTAGILLPLILYRRRRHCVSKRRRRSPC